MSAAPELVAPYKGLVPYSAEDAEFFFGRERERNFITANLLAERLTLLYGASGVGKSSVLRAGVERHIRLLAQDNLQRLGKPKYIIVVFNDWRDPDPVRSLLAKVGETVKRTLANEKVEPVDSSLSLTEALLEWSKRVRGQLLIILDQFEEYFLYHQDKDGPGTFAEEFPRAVKYLGLPANFLVSFREDAFSKLTFFKVRMPDVFGNYLPLEHLDREAGRDAIQKPIDQFNKKLGNGHPVSIEPALVEEVLKQVETGQVILGEAGRGTLKKETGGAEIETPFLQMVMMRLWKDELESGSRVLRLATLENLADKNTGETGSVRIVRTHLDQMMNALSPEQQNIAAEVFHYLVTPSGTKIAHTAPDLAEYASVSKPALKATLEGLATGSMRILRGTSRPGDDEPRYEIFHDVLAAPILDWRNRRMLALRAEEQKQEAEEKAREEEQARSTRRLRVFAAILAVMFIAAVSIAIWAWIQRSKAAAASEQAIKASQEATAARDFALLQQQEATRKSELLETANAELDIARQNERTERDKATENAQRAVKEAAQAREDLRQSKLQIKPDLDAADRNNAFAMGFKNDNPCNFKGLLEENKTEYSKLVDRYRFLRATTEVAHVRQKLKEIDTHLNRLKDAKCESAP